MSGQYPPPNPAHPFNRASLHQRPPPAQSLLPPWGHSPQPSGMNVVGSPMNFYGSPHMGLPSRGAQPWVPPQTHPKPSDSRPGSTNPLFGLQMLMSPETSQRIPSEYQQEETMDLSSHSSVPSTVQDITKIVSARSENSDVLRNGTILSAEVNGDVDRTEAEIKDSIVTSVIAANPLRENVTDALNCSKGGENLVVKRIEQSVPSESVVKSSDSISNTQLNVSVKSESVVSEPLSETVHNFVSFALKTNNNTEPEIKSETAVTDSSVESYVGVGSLEEKDSEEVSQSEDIKTKNVSSNKNDELPKLNESQSSGFDSSSLSVDTDDTKLVVADSSAEDIFGISPVDDAVPVISQESDQSVKTSEITVDNDQSVKTSEIAADTETVPEKKVDSSPVSLTLNEQWPTKPASSVIPTSETSDPHPSVENVEILLENMFNSQEETSSSSQNNSSTVLQSVIVSKGTRQPLEISRPQADIITPMKEEELAMTLAEETPVVVENKNEKQEEKVTSDLMDEIEKKLELLTESKSSDIPKNDDKTQLELLPRLVKEEPSRSLDAEEKKGGDILISEVKEVEGDETTPTEKCIEPSSSPKTETGLSNNPFIEVETQLEKMFAGIVEPTDELGSDNLSQPSSSEPKRPVVNKKTITKRKKANSRRPSDNSVFGGSSGDSTAVKKKGRKRVTDSGSDKATKRIKVDTAESLKKGKIPKDTSSESLSKVKGPFVHIEGSKESPASVVVVNSGLRADDEDGTDKANARRKHSTLQRVEGASRRAGPVYSSSTLSMRYNSDTADLSWVCVFCKRGPHCAGGLGGEPAGDLFGPYRVPATPHSEEGMPPGTPADKDVVDEQKKRGGKYPKSLRTSGAAEHFIQKMAKKNKRSLSSESSDSQPGLLSVDGGYEVWLHGQCAEWAPGLCIIGTQLVGLDDAVWTALRTRCSQCGETGAGIGCVVYNCPARMHYHCAVLYGWLLDTDTFIARCNTHRTRLRPS